MMLGVWSGKHAALQRGKHQPTMIGYDQSLRAVCLSRPTVATNQRCIFLNRYSGSSLLLSSSCSSFRRLTVRHHRSHQLASCLALKLHCRTASSRASTHLVTLIYQHFLSLDYACTLVIRHRVRIPGSSMRRRSHTFCGILLGPRNQCNIR